MIIDDGNPKKILLFSKSFVLLNQARKIVKLCELFLLTPKGRKNSLEFDYSLLS